MTPPTPVYISPLATIHSSFADAGVAVDNGGLRFRLRVDENVDVSSIVQGHRTLIVGEPGVGKTLLMEKVGQRLKADGFSVTSIPLREHEAIGRIDTALRVASNGTRRALLLDGLDEVPSRLLPDVLLKVSAVSGTHPDVAIFISGRWVFVKRYANHFPDYRIVTIHPFMIAQAREYLAKAGHTERDIDRLLERVSFGHRTLILQVPRYLSYLATYVNERGIEAAASLSRNDLFEHFIYRKLELEDKKLNADKRALIKRLLEKLALVMEIYQANVITTDELMTFFDELESDLKLTTLAQVDLEVLYDCSLLRVSQEALDKIEFENAEFQEYLAAKEISRFTDANRTAFGFAVDTDAGELRPSWYNTLTFLVDIQPALLQPIMEFSGLLRDDFRVIEDGFFTFLSRLDPNAIRQDLRSTLFRRVIDYHARALQWVPMRLAGALAPFFDASLDSFLRVRAAGAEAEQGARRYVPLANVAEVVATLLRDRAPLDRAYWKAKLVAYATDDNNNNGVLQRQALNALAELGDPSVIDALQSVPRSDELVARALLQACIELDPDHPGTLQLVFDGMRRNDHYARRGLHRLRKPESVKAMLSSIVDSPEFRRGLLEGLSSFRSEDVAIAEVVKSVLTDEIRNLGKNALVQLLHYDSAHHVERSLFLPALWRVLAEGDPDFAADMVRRIKAARDGKTSFFYARHLFSAGLEERDLGPFFEAMRAADDVYGAMAVMQTIKHSGRPNAEALYEAGRLYAPDAYANLETAPTAGGSAASRERVKKMLREFRRKLRPKPEQFKLDVFEYYNLHASELDPFLKDQDRARLRELIVGTVFRWDPAEHTLKITSDGQGGTTFTTSMAVRVFEEAAATAQRLGLDVTPYRPAVLSLIPFAYDDELRTIFALVPQINAGELDRVLEVYTRRTSDLWRHRPASLIEAVKRYHAVEAVPVLKALVTEVAIDNHAREQALIVADSLAPDTEFLRAIFERYRLGGGTERDLAEIANASLITSHADGDAIRWRLAELEARAAPIEKRGRRRRRTLEVSALESEISFGKAFAQPLMKLSERGYEGDYLRLLEKATILWVRGTQFHAYAQYLWDIVYAYFDNLKESRSYEPLRLLEAKLRLLKDHEGANWLAGKMVAIRRAYLEHLGRPRGITDAVARYNEARKYSVKSIRTSSDLFQHLKDAIETDLRRWVEGEGAYRVLVLESRKSGRRRHHEELVQKTAKTQVENILLKRGFQIDVAREEQLLDDKRVDFLVRYGFAGPVVVEVKLTSNTDLRVRKLTETRSYRSMKRYIDGFGAPHGIFLVIDNTKARNLSSIAKAYELIPNVHVQTLDCAAGIDNTRTRSTRAPKKRDGKVKPRLPKRKRM